MERTNFYGKGNDAFVCEKCNQYVEPLSNGSFRNHCPYCLSSKHVDIVPGDRRETCQGLMEPVRIEHSHKRWILVHRCILCRKVQRNRSALDDNVELIIQLMS